jgi:class 3 adenylate cyclase/pimeloyl-ACP methyl ester carboxylesterase
MWLVKIPETRYAPMPDEGFLAYKVIGDGPVDLAVLGSLPSQIEVYFEYEPAARFILDLASSTRLILHDRRGTGLSDAGGGVPDLETRAADLRVILDAARSSRAFLFGISDGGSVAALLAAEDPERVAGFIWYAASARNVRAPDWPYGDSSEELDRLNEKSMAAWGQPDNLRRAFEEAGASLDSDLASWLAKMQRAFGGPETGRRYYGLEGTHDVRAILPTLRVPTLVLDADIYLDEEAPRYVGAAKATAALIPESIYQRLPGTTWVWEDSDLPGIIRYFIGVQRPPPELDRVLATVLFTDIVDSTKRLSELGDASWRSLLRNHDERSRAQIDRFRGRYVDSTGDGLLATFDGPARAVRCAQAIGESVRDLGVEIRSGVHTGEVELAGDQIRGMTVHVGARVAALGGPSEIWVSQTVKDLTVGSGLAFEDRGEYELKGAPDRWHLYLVVP